MPLAKPAPDNTTSRLARTLKRKETTRSSPLPAAGPSTGQTSTIERPRKVGRIDVDNAPEPTASSSRTTSILPEQNTTSPGFTEFLETLTTGSSADVLHVEPPPSRPTESTFLAQKIRSLLPALSSRFLSSSKDVSVVDSNGRPIPPPGAVRIQDPDLISLLSNPEIMNGSDGRRQSVWSMLETIRPPNLENVESVDENDEYAGSDRSSIMMYSPLIPNADSVIELAELEDAPVARAGPSSGSWLSTFQWPSWSTVWPFNGWKAKDGTEEQDITPGQSPAIHVTESEPPPNSVEERRQVPVQRIWVPSTTQLSFETTWWGYRIYLPPPVLAILDDQSVEAARQATTITAALTWFFSNLPVSAFPPPVQPAILLLQRLVPFVSYIGTFISWSWSTIRGFDRGHGVILTATWLLPIALIPGTWHARDVPPPSTPSSPIQDSVSAFVLPPEDPAPADMPWMQTAAVLEPGPWMPAAPVLGPVPLPPCSPDDAPVPHPPLKQRKSSGKTKTKAMSTLRKLTRTLT